MSWVTSETSVVSFAYSRKGKTHLSGRFITAVWRSLMSESTPWTRFYRWTNPLSHHASVVNESAAQLRMEWAEGHLNLVVIHLRRFSVTLCLSFMALVIFLLLETETKRMEDGHSKIFHEHNSVDCLWGCLFQLNHGTYYFIHIAPEFRNYRIPHTREEFFWSQT